jgi:hypothetical protein
VQERFLGLPLPAECLGREQVTELVARNSQGLQQR